MIDRLSQLLSKHTLTTCQERSFLTKTFNAGVQSEIMEVITVNLLLLKFSVLINAASQPFMANQKFFTKVTGQGKCHVLRKKVHIFLSQHTAGSCVS